MKISDFSKLNLARCLRWHPMGITSWSASDWMTALVGEVGEAANNIKKLNRIRDNLPGNAPEETEEFLKAKLAKELADSYCYLDLLASSQGWSMQDLVAAKFDAVSEKVGFPERFGMIEHFVMWNGAAWFVKEGDFFRDQGGLDESWGEVLAARVRAEYRACPKGCGGTMAGRQGIQNARCVLLMNTIEERLKVIEARQQQIIAGMGLLATLLRAHFGDEMSPIQRQALKKMANEAYGELQSPTSN